MKRITKKEMVKQIKELLDKNRIRITTFMVELIDKNGDLFKEELLAFDSEQREFIKTKPYGRKYSVIIKNKKGKKQ